ncbi:MAG TPA: ADP-ribosylglycohydrolase family protein [Propionibacteriaceae bacterium]|nr:ADP-ribosylglycohydrolase family protein [Propionibacteriaceae bacterium]
MSSQPDRPTQPDLRTPQWVDASVRGMLVGLALGNSVASWDRWLIPAGVASQLAAFTADGLIRGSISLDNGGADDLPTFLWAGLQRWAACQGIETRESFLLEELVAGHPSGWLAQVPALRERRGSAPATVKALANGPTHSLGSHGMVRTLPLAAAYRTGPPTSDLMPIAGLVATTAQQVTATKEAVSCAVAATMVAAMAGDEQYGDVDLAELVRIILTLGPLAGSEVADLLKLAIETADTHPGDRRVFQELGGHRTAPVTLAAAVFAAASHPRVEHFTTAVRLAALSPDGASAAALTGAILGSRHGIHALPADLVARHELGWVMDGLGRDICQQLTTYPGGNRGGRPALPGWLAKYPRS